MNNIATNLKFLTCTKHTNKLPQNFWSMSNFNLAASPAKASSTQKSSATFNLVADNPTKKKTLNDLKHGGLLIFAVSEPLIFNGMQTNIPNKLTFSFYGVFVADDVNSNSEHGSVISVSVTLVPSNFSKLKLPKDGDCIKIHNSWEIATKTWSSCKYSFTVDTPVFTTAEAKGLDSLCPDVLSKYHQIKTDRNPMAVQDMHELNRNEVIQCLEGTIIALLPKTMSLNSPVKITVHVAKDSSNVSFAHWGTHSMKIGSKVAIWNSTFQEHKEPYPPSFKLTVYTAIWLSNAAFSHNWSTAINASDNLSGIPSVYDTIEELKTGWETFKNEQPPTPSPCKPSKSVMSTCNSDDEEENKARKMGKTPTKKYKKPTSDRCEDDEPTKKRRKKNSQSSSDDDDESNEDKHFNAYQPATPTKTIPNHFCVLKKALVTTVTKFEGCDNICNMAECDQEVDKTGFCNSNRQDCKEAKRLKTRHQKEKQIKAIYIVKTAHDQTTIELCTTKTSCSIVGHNPIYWHTKDNARNFAEWQEKNLSTTEFDLQLKIWGSVMYPRYELRGVLNANDENFIHSSLAPFVDKCRQLESDEAYDSNEKNDDE